MLSIGPKVHSWLGQKGKITATLTLNLMLFSECLKLSFPTNVVFEIPNALEYIMERSTIEWVGSQVLPLSLPNCVTLGMLLNLSGQFPHL